MIPCGLNVLHRCDNPPCCNPAHLFIGTQADNVADMCAKGRQATREKVCNWKKDRKGENNPNWRGGKTMG